MPSLISTFRAVAAARKQNAALTEPAIKLADNRSQWQKTSMAQIATWDLISQWLLPSSSAVELSRCLNSATGDVSQRALRVADLLSRKIKVRGYESGKPATRTLMLREPVSIASG